MSVVCVCVCVFGGLSLTAPHFVYQGSGHSNPGAYHLGQLASLLHGLPVSALRGLRLQEGRHGHAALPQRWGRHTHL